MNKQRMSGVTLMPKQHNKLTRSALYIREHAAVFCCPICSSSMEVRELKSLSCSNQHTFDFAKQGYLNLMTQHTQTNYDKELFDARSEEHTSELQSRGHLVCRLLLEKKKKTK